VTVSIRPVCWQSGPKQQTGGRVWPAPLAGLLRLPDPAHANQADVDTARTRLAPTRNLMVGGLGERRTGKSICEEGSRPNRVPLGRLPSRILNGDYSPVNNFRRTAAEG